MKQNIGIGGETHCDTTRFLGLRKGATNPLVCEDNVYLSTVT